jgi:hypothetical protein
LGVQVLARPDSTLQIVELQNAIVSLWGAVKVGYLIGYREPLQLRGVLDSALI